MLVLPPRGRQGGSHRSRFQQLSSRAHLDVEQADSLLAQRLFNNRGPALDSFRTFLRISSTFAGALEICANA